MKSFFFFATILTMVYYVQAIRTNLSLMVNNQQMNEATGKLSVVLHGVETTKEYTFNQNKFNKYIQEVTGFIDFPDEDIEKVDVKWVSENDDSLKIGLFITKVEFDVETFSFENENEVILKNGNTATLFRDNSS